MVEMPQVLAHMLVAIKMAVRMETKTDTIGETAPMTLVAQARIVAAATTVGEEA